MTEGPEKTKVPRRLAAILAADIAGYSALMGADEADTVRNLKQHQAVVLPMIKEHGGRIIDTAGDGILAEFGSVVNAVECAVAIQRVMAQRNADAACASASASIKVMSSLTTPVSMATASTSLPGSKTLQSPRGHLHLPQSV
jgi:class 3 adenylate cyclase